MREPYAVTLTLTLYTDATSPDEAADRIEAALGVLLQRRALWRVEEVQREAETRDLDAPHILPEDFAV